MRFRKSECFFGSQVHLKCPPGLGFVIPDRIPYQAPCGGVGLGSGYNRGLLSELYGPQGRCWRRKNGRVDPGVQKAIVGKRKSSQESQHQHQGTNEPKRPLVFRGDEIQFCHGQN